MASSKNLCEGIKSEEGSLQMWVFNNCCDPTLLTYFCSYLMEIPIAAEISQCVFNVFEKLEQELLDSRFLHQSSKVTKGLKETSATGNLQ